MKKGDVITHFTTLIMSVNGLNLSIKRQNRLKTLTYFLIGINRLDVKGWKIIPQVKNLKASRSRYTYIKLIIPVKISQKR